MGQCFSPRRGAGVRAWVLGLVSYSLPAFAADEGVNPRLTAEPTLGVRVGETLSTIASVPSWDSDVAARVGVNVERRALTARASFSADARWSFDDSTGAGTATLPYLSEAWIGLNPAISESLVVKFWVGRQAVQFHEGRILGTADRNLRGDFPDVARISLRAAPWEFEAIGGADIDESGTILLESTDIAGESPRAVVGAVATPLLYLRAGASRDTPTAHWVADLVYGTTNADHDEEDEHTIGLYGKADAGRVRARLDAYFQPFSESTAWLAGARTGWAIGDDARVVLGIMGDARSGAGESSRPFTRPAYDSGVDFGWINLWEPGSTLGNGGVWATGIYTEAKVVPSLRLEAGLQHAAAIENDFQALQVQADLRWWLTPLSAVHVRSAVLMPYSAGDSVLTCTAISLDLTI